MARIITPTEQARLNGGITKAHKRAAALEGDLEAVKGWLSDISMSLVLVERTAATVPTLRGEVSELRSLLKEAIRGNAVNPGSIDPQTVASLEERVKKVDGDLAVLTDRVNGHDVRLNSLEGKIGSHNERIESVEVCSNANASAIASLRQRVDGGLNPFVLVLALVAGIASSVFVAQYDWTTITKKAGTTKIIGAPVLESWIGVGIAGIAAFAFVIFIASLAGMMFGGNDAEETTSIATASAGSEVRMTRGPSGPPTAVQPAIVLPEPAPPVGASQPVG